MIKSSRAQIEAKVEKLLDQVNRAQGFDYLGDLPEDLEEDLVDKFHVGALHAKMHALEKIYKSGKKLLSEWMKRNIEDGVEMEGGNVRIKRFTVREFEVKTWQDWARGPFGDVEAKAAIVHLDAYKAYEVVARKENSQFESRVKVSLI